MSNSGLRHRRSHQRPAFTLAELLIVIAIIAVLISILLPSLSAARRSANSVKCLSSLKQIGQAFLMYAQDYQRAYPVVYWNPGAGFATSGTAAQKPWQDFLVKYLQKSDPTVLTTPAGAADILKFRENSVIWGCPSYISDAYVSLTAAPAANAPNVFNSGYGMSRFALAPYADGGNQGPSASAGVQRPGLPVGTGNVATVNPQNSPAAQWGTFMKMEQWGRRGAEKGIVADSNTFDLTYVSSGAVTRSTLGFQPFATPISNRVDVDAVRHLSPTALSGAVPTSNADGRWGTYNKVKASRGVNMLFVDGHAASVSPIEAWVAIRGGGSNYSNP